MRDSVCLARPGQSYLDRFASFSDRLTLYSGNQAYMDTHTGSPENLRLASLWVESCLSEHSKCVKSQRQLPRLPTRVIDVGNQNDSKPFLFEPKGGCGAYFTLSYCWGGHRGLTTSATYKNYCNEIPLDSLPRTFRDAIKVTRSFGCRFLWLDSLCIIQDVEQDKHREVALMGEIYRNTLLTIAAAKGADPDAGLFAEREPRTQRPCRLPSRLIGIIPESFVSTELDSKRANLNTLDLRAWVLQEIVLSTRLLIFGRDRLEWSCLEGQASEKEPVPGGYRTVYERFRNLIHRPIRSPRKGISLSFGTHVLEWYDIVENYSNRFLTRSEDILPAISGLASRMHDLHGGTYLAGLWKEDIQGGLCWYIQSQRKSDRHTRPLYQTAPSWSWASRTNAVIRFLPRGRGFFNPSRELGLSLEIANCFPRSTYQNRYGEVDGGFLLARGALKPAIAVFKTDTEDLQDTFLGTEVVATGWIAVVRDPVSHRETGVVAFDEQPQGEEKTSEIVCFLTQVYEFPVPLGLQFTCLALVHTGSSEEEYRRVGLVTLSDQHWFGCPESQTFIKHRKTVKIV